MVSPSILDPYRDTDFYKISQFGFYSYSTTARHQGYAYPKPTDIFPPGPFYVGYSGAATGDFNGDGHQDLLVAWYASPHNVPNNLNLVPTIFLNDGTGALNAAPSIFTGKLPLVPYRPVVADFNGDGVDDVVMAGSVAFQTPNPNGTFTNHRDPIKLVLSQPGGKMFDASDWIQGQANGGQAVGYDFGHDMSVGDIDGDGDKDFYSGRVLFINDGSGHFTSKSDLLPLEGRLQTTHAMSSAIGDLDRDGVDDIVVTYFEGNTSYVLYSRLKNGGPGWKVESLPTGLYGQQNTKFNFATTADVNNDGWSDIIFAETRATPYYVGRSLQILINQQGKGFVDETSLRIDNAPRDRNSGEGELSIVDVDGDGDLDIWDSTNTNEGPTDSGASIALNDGRGHFTWMDRSKLAVIYPNQLAGYEHNVEFPVPRLFPIDLDGKGGIDYIGLVYTPTIEKLEFSLYTAISTTSGPVPALVSSYPAAALTQFITGSNPSPAEMSIRTQAATDAYSYYANVLKVANPNLGPYESLGVSFSYLPAFQTKYGAGAIAANAAFVDKAYQDVFLRAPTAGQKDAFLAQIDYFTGIYQSAGKDAATALQQARGAVVGQMTGYVMTDPSEYSRAGQTLDDKVIGFVGAQASNTAADLFFV